MIKLCAFDLDGTLINSLEDLCNSTNLALAKNNFKTHQIEDYKLFIGDGVLKLIERALPIEQKNNTVLINSIKKDFDYFYEINYNKLTKPYLGIDELLVKLKSRGVLLAVISNKPHEFTTKLVSEIFGDKFDFVLGQSEKFDKKPSPDALNYILKKYSLTNKECCFVGDSGIDILTAKNAHVLSIGVTWGFRGILELKNQNADYIAKKPINILEFIDFYNKT